VPLQQEYHDDYRLPSGRVFAGVPGEQAPDSTPVLWNFAAWKHGFPTERMRHCYRVHRLDHTCFTGTVCSTQTDPPGFAIFRKRGRESMDGSDILRSLDELRRKLIGKGWAIREEWLNGGGCHMCEVRGQKVVFVDISLTPREQLAQLQGLCSALESRVNSAEEFATPA